MFQDLSGSESYHSMPWFLQTPWELPGQVLDGSPEEVLQASALKAFDKDGRESQPFTSNIGTPCRVNSFNSNIGQHVDLAPPSKSYEGRQGDDVCSC